jgi:hypothetical protein
MSDALSYRSIKGDLIFVMQQMRKCHINSALRFCFFLPLLFAKSRPCVEMACILREEAGPANGVRNRHVISKIVSIGALRPCDTVAKTSLEAIVKMAYLKCWNPVAGSRAVAGRTGRRFG